MEARKRRKPEYSCHFSGASSNSIAHRNLRAIAAVLATTAVLAMLAARPCLGGLPSPRFERLSDGRGFFQQIVQCMVQDDIGFLWLGTQGGLFRYDGYSFKKYEAREAPRALRSNDIRALFVDRSGTLWIGTHGGGLSRLDYETDSFETYRSDRADETSLPDDQIRAIQQDDAGNLWVGTWKDGLALLDLSTGRFRRFSALPNTPDALSSDNIRDLLKTRDGQIWVATLGGGLCRFNPRSPAFECYRNVPDDNSSLSSDSVRALVESPDGNLWIATWGGGLNRFDRDRKTFERFHSGQASGMSDDVVLNLTLDGEGGLWLATFRGGLNHFDTATRRFRTFGYSPHDVLSLSSDLISSVFLDRSGILWIGTGAGLNRYSPATGRFGHHRDDPTEPNDLSGSGIRAFLSESDRVLWVGTRRSGLNRLDRETGRSQVYRHDKNVPWSIAEDAIFAMVPGEEDSIWVATWHSGLDRFNPVTERFEHFRHDPGDPTSLSDDRIRALLIDREGSLWVGTFGGGLNLFDRNSGRFRSYRNREGDLASLSDDRIHALGEAPDGTILVGTREGGLNKFDPDLGVFETFRSVAGDPTSLNHDTVNAICRDESGRVWIATDGGLNRFDYGTGTFRRYGPRQGLPSDRVYAVADDDDGQIWVSTAVGLSRLDPVEETFRNYDAEDGLQTADFNMGAVLRADSGELMFGGNDGFNAFFPRSIQENPHVPPMVVTSFKKLNSEVFLAPSPAARYEVEIGPDDSVVSFEFAALDFVAPQRNRYSYRLEPAKEWISIGNRREVTFANLEPGDYALRVRGGNNDGLWNEDGLTLSLRVSPPFWGTWWFQGATLVGLVLLLFGGYRLRTASIQGRNRALQREIQDRLRVEDALRKSESRLLEAQKIGRIGHWEIDLATNAMEWSEEVYSIHGVSHDDFDGDVHRIIDSVIHPDDRVGAKESLKKMLAEEPGPKESGYRVIHSDGSIHYLQGRGRLHRDDDGNPVRLSGTVQDVTEERVAEEAIRKSEERLRLALESAAMGTWEWNIESNEVRWSDQVEPIFGLAPGEFSGTLEAYRGLIHPDDRDRVEEAIADALSSGREYHIEHRVSWPDESVHWVFGRGRAYYDGSGSAIGMAGTVTDITVSRNAEKALLESQQQLVLALEATHVGTWERDISKDSLTWDERARQIFGHPGAAPLTYKTFIGHVLESDRERVRQATQAALAGLREYDIDYRIVRPDGMQRSVISRGAVVRDDSGVPVRMRGVCLDVTRRMEAEERLRVSEERYRSVVSAMAEGVALYDRETRLVAHNSSAAKILGLTSEQMSGHTLTDTRWKVVHEDGSPFTADQFPAAVTLRHGVRSTTSSWEFTSRPEA